MKLLNIYHELALGEYKRNLLCQKCERYIGDLERDLERRGTAAYTFSRTISEISDLRKIYTRLPPWNQNEAPRILLDIKPVTVKKFMSSVILRHVLC